MLVEAQIAEITEMEKDAEETVEALSEARVCEVDAQTFRCSDVRVRDVWHCTDTTFLTALPGAGSLQC